MNNFQVQEWVTEYSTRNECHRYLRDQTYWIWVSKELKLSESFIRKFQFEVNWMWISQYQKLSENFIRDFQNLVNWPVISKFQILSENFIREFQDRVYWGHISCHQNLSEAFIREFQNQVNWLIISIDQRLSEDFIHEFQNRVDWNFISGSQTLTEEFILAHSQIPRKSIKKFSKLSDQFIVEHRNLLDFSLAETVFQLSIRCIRILLLQFQKLPEVELLERLSKHDKHVKMSQDWLVLWAVLGQT